MTMHDDKTKSAAVKLLARGETTVGELAYFLDMHRQTVQYWADCAGIDVPELRFRYLERKWRGVAS